MSDCYTKQLLTPGQASSLFLGVFSCCKRLATTPVWRRVDSTKSVDVPNYPLVPKYPHFPYKFFSTLMTVE